MKFTPVLPVLLFLVLGACTGATPSHDSDPPTGTGSFSWVSSSGEAASMDPATSSWGMSNSRGSSLSSAPPTSHPTASSSSSSLLAASSSALATSGATGGWSAVSSRTSSPASAGLCNNGTRDPGEVCDGQDLHGQMCVLQGFTAGVLACNALCTGFDTSQCTLCGDNHAESGEVCDGADVLGQSCVDHGFSQPGSLRCFPGCRAFDTAGCLTPSFTQYVGGMPAIAPDGTMYFRSNSGWAWSLKSIKPDRSDGFTSEFPDRTDLSRPSVGQDGVAYVTFRCDSLAGCVRPSDLVAVTPQGTQRWYGVRMGWLQDDEAPPPTVGPDGTVYVYDESDLRAIHPTTGQQLWSAPIPTSRAYGRPVVVGADGSILVSGERPSPSWEEWLYSVSSEGRENWRVRLSDRAHSLALDPQGNIYLSLPYEVRVLGPDGSLRWSHNVATDSYAHDPPTLLVAADQVLVAESGVGIYALRKSDGTQQWVQPLTLTNSALALLGDGTLLAAISSSLVGGSLCAFNTLDNGAVRWCATVEPHGDRNSTKLGVTVAPTLEVLAVWGLGQLYVYPGTSPLADVPWPVAFHDPRNSSSMPSAQCGNGTREGAETCDGADLGGLSCGALRFQSGTLACSAGCTPDMSQCTGAAGCTIDGVAFTAAEQACAMRFFTTMTCADCDGVLDSRTCEDAINDPAACMVGTTCTGCADLDTRADGVTCAEIEGYDFLGAAAAADLLTYVRAHPCL